MNNTKVLQCKKEIIAKDEDKVLIPEPIGRNIDSSNQSQDKRKLIQYADVISFENLKYGLERTKSNVSPGIDGEVKSDISDNRLQKLHLDLKDHTFKPSPSRRVQIPRANGGVRYLGIASQIDKVVQGALLTKLEPVLEKVFNEKSYGSRPGKSCHSALRDIKYGWKGVTWLINVDISKCFDTLQHDRILKLMSIYCDQATVELLRKFLRVGYVDIHNLNDRSEYSTVGTPQGSLISPIISNLYLHELDSYVMNELRPLFNKGEERRRNAGYQERYKLSEKDKEILEIYPELAKTMKKVKHNRVVMSGPFAATDSQDDSFRRLNYVRYVDDFILGFIGPRKEAEEIMDLIKSKLSTMELAVNESKSKVIHSGEKGTKYLGMYLRYFHENKTVKRELELTDNSVDKTVTALRAQAVNTVHFRAPIDKMLARLVERGLAKSREGGTIRGTAYLKISLLEDADIIRRYNAIIRSILNYYSCINHRSDLWKVLAILRKSCALTLAHKHKLDSAARVFSKFGPLLTIRNEMGQEVAKLSYPKSLKTSIDFKIKASAGISPSIIDIVLDKVPGSTKTNIKVAEVCEADGCETTQNLQAHHLNPMAGINKRKDLSSFEKALIARKRKVVMLCKKHHNQLHRKGLLRKGETSGKAS